MSRPDGFQFGPHHNISHCPHLDAGICQGCIEEHPEIVGGFGEYWWLADAEERATFIEELRFCGELT